MQQSASTDRRRPSGRRVLAAVIDLLAYWTVTWAVFLSVAETIATDAFVAGNPDLHITLGDTTRFLEGGDASLFSLFTLAVGLVWFGLLPGSTGWTPGKLVSSLRVVRPDGTPAGVGRNLLRALLWVVDGFPYVVPGVVGFILVFANKGRRVADLAADTYVVRASEAGQPVAQAAAVGPPTEPPPAGFYPDPAGGGGQRWWDGSEWTDNTRA